MSTMSTMLTPMTATEPIVVNNTAEFTTTLAQVNARGQRISQMKRGRTNSQWILEIVDDVQCQPPKPATLQEGLLL